MQHFIKILLFLLVVVVHLASSSSLGVVDDIAAPIPECNIEMIPGVTCWEMCREGLPCAGSPIELPICPLQYEDQLEPFERFANFHGGHFKEEVQHSNTSIVFLCFGIFTFVVIFIL